VDNLLKSLRQLEQFPLSAPLVPDPDLASIPKIRRKRTLRNAKPPVMMLVGSQTTSK